jgi:glycosyltransferase involved in cell wall biosynthesis
MMTSSPANADQPAVTILMASYGRLEFLKLAVDSALGQQYDNYEILIVDDGSEEEVVGWLKLIEAKEPKLSVVYQAHQGVAVARAVGVEKSDTDLICILDSDDILLEQALIELVAATNRHASVQIVYCDNREIRSNGKATHRRFPRFNSARSMILATLLKPRVPFKHSGTLFRRQTAIDLGSYDRNLPCKVDVDLYLKFLRAGHIPLHVDQVLVEFRMHKNSVSIDRLTGIRVWLGLIDRYGPGNRVYRFLIKTVRVSAELLKRVYIEILG